ncbi:unnamed protein product [Brassica oleracea var. botrytis]|uniref:Alpha-1,3/1,6-mannosyltransferase ALG2 n=1 Tax=Brassica napus TaxID=3708 RepID=A0A816QS73_BRANA|nr:unnamed protein product [Brassica napus]
MGMRKEGSKKMNIAIIHPDLGIGGAERLIVDAAVELASQGHKVHVFTSHHDKSRCFEETLSGIFQVTVYGSFLPRHIFYRLHAVCAYLRCLFVALCVLLGWSSFDVVLADQVSVVVPLLKLKRSSKVVFYCHFPDLLLAKHTTPLRRMYRKPIDFLEEQTTGMADMILVNSNFTASTFAKTFKRLHARGSRPAVLYPAVNVDQFIEPHAHKLNFLSINRFEKKKNIDLAVSAFAILCKHKQTLSDDVTLTVAGGYDERLKENVEYLEELKSLAEKEGVSNRVSFITSCSTAERNELLSSCLCVLYTPTDEHFGIVPLEAMAAYKPVIACNSGGPVETVKSGETGYLCEPSPEDFSSAMAKFVEDPELARRMGSEARKHVVESFSAKTFGEKLNQYLVDVVSILYWYNCLPLPSFIIIRYNPPSELAVAVEDSLYSRNAMDANNAFDSDLIHAIFKHIWARRFRERERSDAIDATDAEVALGTSKKNRLASANANALKLSCELLKSFVSEAVQRAAIIAEAEGMDKIEASHLERILPQLLLDF